MYTPRSFGSLILEGWHRMNAAEQGNENQARGTHRQQEVNKHVTIVARILLPVPLLNKYYYLWSGI